MQGMLTVVGAKYIFNYHTEMQLILIMKINNA